MKRVVTLTMLALLAICLPAQTTFTIGTASVATYGPVFTNWDHTVSQQIYTLTELSDGGLVAGSITHIAFQAHTPIDLSVSEHNSWLIYMGETTESVFTAGSWIPLGVMTQVFRGTTPEVSLIASEWLTIPLEPPYPYLGTGNLVIFVNEYSPGHSGAAFNRFRGTTETGQNRLIYSYGDNEPYVPEGDTPWGNGTPNATRPNLQITYTMSNISIDIAITTFTGPAQIPGTTDMLITVSNLGTQNILENAYTIAIYEDEVDNILHNITSTTALNGGSFAFQTYTISAETYNAWQYTSQVATPLTLRATVSLNEDGDLSNNNSTLNTNLRPAYDLQILSFTAPAYVPTMQPMTIDIQNNGRSAVVAGSYKVEIYENTETTPLFIIADLNTPAIPLASSTTLTISPTDINQALFTPTLNGGFTFNLLLTSQTVADDDPSNNTSSAGSFLIKNNGTVVDTIIEVGVQGTAIAANVPFNTNFNDNLAQFIYSEADLNHVAGIITHINYKVRMQSLDNHPNPYPVSIYMASYDKPNGFGNTSDWVPGSEFTCVVNDFNLPIQTLGDYDLWIPLSSPYPYSGGDLIVMTYKDHTGHGGVGNQFFRAPNETNYVTLVKQRDESGDPYNPADPTIGGDASVRINFKPQTRFAFFTRYRVSGTVQGDEGETIVGLSIALTNQADGGYSPADIIITEDGTFSFTVPPGMYIISITKQSETGNITYTHPDEIHVTDADILNILVNLPAYLAQNNQDIAPVFTMLHGNYPNPFNPSTTISFSLAEESHVAIDIYNIKGQKVKTLTNENYTSGRHILVWNGDDNYGNTVSSGIYFYQMTAAKYQNVRKMVIMK